jgi:type VI secretion system protein ImpH
MGSFGWRDRRSVAAGLFEEGHRFSFLQAVRLMEKMSPENRTAPAEGTDPEQEAVHFRHAVRLDFPPSDVELVRRGDEGPAEMVVNVLGLAGAHGPLPPAVSELIVERSFRGDTAFRDFLDIFNHRLISLLYRARKKYRPALDTKAPEDGRVANVVNAFLGLATPHLLGQMAFPDRALLPYAGLIVDQQRSAVGLIRMLEAYFEIKVAIAQFAGQWNVIDQDDLTRIGKSGANQVLGRGAVLAYRLWDQEATFELQVGPLTLEQFFEFLPFGRSYAPLVAAVRFYVREELGFSVRLQIQAREVPQLKIGLAHRAYLGWTTWLREQPFTSNDAQVRVPGRA